MSARVVDVDQGIVTLRISGTLSNEEYTSSQKEISDAILKAGKVRILILAEDFEGWEKGGNWNDVSFQLAHDGDIERMAIVSNRKWEDTARLFTGSGLRRFPIEFFDSADIGKARTWINE
ncbi:MAG TPA: STAS/SEC14 domain-containing protein [Candidatus Hydrogenedentes bacterium]|nr:STAS/SEC14 domain-containing protein [Candidatus Hydrogenedentota bacterium]